MNSNEKVEDAKISDSTPNEQESNQMIESTKAESPAIEPASLEQWNKPRINMYRYLAAIYSFIIMGMNDAAYGVSPESPNKTEIKLNLLKGFDSIRMSNYNLSSFPSLIFVA